MATAVAAFTTPFAATSYLSVSEYRHSPTGVDTSNLVPRGMADDEDSELTNVIARASSLADQYCNQVLAATVDVEATTAWIDRRGRLKFHPDFWPVLEVRDLQFGYQPNLLSTVSDLSNLWIGRQMLYAHLDSLGTTTQGPLAFGSVGVGQQVYVRYAYVNGYPNTTLASAANLGDTTITVNDATGIYGGSSTVTSTALTPATVLALYDGANTERRLSVASVAGGILSLNAPLTSAHPAGAQVSAVPAAIRQAVIFLTSALIKTRGNEAVVMQSVSSSNPVQAQSGTGSSDLTMAFMALAPFRRVR